ncbi:SDR family oxidoreductase [Microbacterium awajiense]|uniref:SDR family oxidoreductase n=1 Tax=Microbacterium awajiense TaxID=415214 RepID=A0ABP7A1B9_9MICO
MTDVLVLGGTGWLSGLTARRWRDAGASVTCLARGSHPAPEGTTLVVGDRDAADAYAGVADRDWDEVVDVSRDAGQVASAVAALADRTAHWTFVSTISVYADDDAPGADETARLLPPLRPGDEYDYGRAKVAAEAAVRDGVGDRVAIIRPGLIVGPGDPTDRFGYWVSRLALAGDGPVLAPDGEGRSVQVIDVRDLADALVRVGEDRRVGVANATGSPMPFDAFLQDAVEAAGFAGALLRASDEWMLAHEVAYWMGPRSLPLWLPADMIGFATRDTAAYGALGGRIRPIAQTLRDTLADERTRGLDRARASGLSRADELALIAELPHF